MQERPSRQELVVAPQGRSPIPLIAGVLLCGVAGFGVVWISGMGRTLPVTDVPFPPPPAAAAIPDPTFSPVAAPAGQAAADSSTAPSRFAAPAETKPLATAAERFPTRPASFEPPATFRDEPAAAGSTPLDAAVTPAAAEAPASPPKDSKPESQAPAAEPGEAPQRLSRFSARQISPPADPAADSPSPGPPAPFKPAEIQPARVEPAADEPASTDGEAAETAAEKPAAAAVQTDQPAAAEAAPDTAGEAKTDPLKSPVAEPSAAAPKPAKAAPVEMPATAAPAAEAPAAKPASVPVKPAAVPPPQARGSQSPKPVADATIQPPAAAAAPPEVAAAPAEPSPEPPLNSPAAGPAASLPPPGPAPEPLASDAAAAPLASRANPFARSRPAAKPKPDAPLRATGAAVPFAAAPPLAGPPPASDAAPADRRPSGPAGGKQPDPASTSPPAAAETGQGRPGPPQLEGLQAPQLTIEKSGPRDLQVGKPARFEVTIRNVGSATAHDTVLRDAIPYGTSLIATMPPASPAVAGDSGGDLLWDIGDLDPGQEARVALELMPRLEGEIGSVASVSFRADASVRSRVTKPALEITAEPPAATLIGETMTVEVTLANPGTGTATGVVVEGQLPEAVTHPAGREVEFDVGQLEPGATRKITLALTTVTPGVHQILLAARADGGIEVAQRLRAEITAPMLELAADIPNRRYLQRPATCRLKMTNTGTAPALAVELAAQLPAGMKFVRANNAGYYDERTHRVLWSLEELPAGEAGTVDLVVMPTTLGPQPIVVATRNPAGLADQLTHTIEVEGLAALSFEVADSEDPIEVGGLTEYVVRVANQGTKAATSVELAANLLGDLEPIDATGPVPFGVENLTVSFDPLATLAPADEVVFRVRVRGRRPGNQRVQFMLKSDDLKTPLTAEEITHVYADR